MADRADVRLRIHDAGRVEWVATIPLPERGEEGIELEFAAEVPAHVWTDHDHWGCLQLMSRLGSPSDDEETGPLPPPHTLDDLRRSALAAVHRNKEAREQLHREIFSAVSLVADPPPDLAGRIRAAVARALDDLAEEREQLFRPEPGESTEMVRERRLVAEFLSNHAIDFIAGVLHSIDDELCGARSRQKAGYLDVAAELRPFLAERLAREFAYRREHGFLCPEERNPSLLERYVARASQLKKHFQEVLFLELEAERADRRFRNLYGAVAATLAALWALPLGFLLTGGAGLTGLGLGLGSTLALLVASYAVKDRIKEMARDWLSHRVSRYAGRITDLSVPARLLETPWRIARVRESFFVQRSTRTDPLNPDLGPTRPVVVLRYLFRGTVRGDPRLAWQGLDRLKLVFRYDLTPLFARLDDPIKELPVLASDGRDICFAEAARSYRLPIRIALRHRGVEEEEEGVLVAHKLGLERLERRVPQPQSPSHEEHGPAAIPWPTLRLR